MRILLNIYIIEIHIHLNYDHHISIFVSINYTKENTSYVRWIYFASNIMSTYPLSNSVWGASQCDIQYKICLINISQKIFLKEKAKRKNGKSRRDLEPESMASSKWLRKLRRDLFFSFTSIKIWHFVYMCIIIS